MDRWECSGGILSVVQAAAKVSGISPTAGEHLGKKPKKIKKDSVDVSNLLLRSAGTHLRYGNVTGPLPSKPYFMETYSRTYLFGCATVTQNAKLIL